MALHTKTITNSLYVWGPEATTKWDDAELPWDTAKWDYGSQDLQEIIRKYILNTFTLTSSVGKKVKLSQSNVITVTEDMLSEYLRDQQGYYYEFVIGASDGEDRPSNTYSPTSNVSSTWASGSVSSTSWSSS